MHWYVDVLKKYATFGGRARRQEFWMFYLFNLIIDIVLQVIDTSVDTTIPASIYSLALVLPTLALGVRRMHDTNRSGWWILLPIVNLVFFCFEGDRGDNKYGSDPKAQPALA